MEHLKGMQMKRELRQRIQKARDLMQQNSKQDGIDSDSDNYGDDHNSPKKAREKKAKANQDESVESSQKLKE